MHNFELAKELFFSGLDSFQNGDYLSAEKDFRVSTRRLFVGRKQFSQIIEKTSG